MANKEQLEILSPPFTKANLNRRPVDKANDWDEYLKNHPDKKIDLSDSRLYGLYLEGINLSGANLSGANLADADLIDVDLSRANLSDTFLHCTNFSESNLDQADFTGANLNQADLTGAKNVTREQLQKATLKWTTLEEEKRHGLPLFKLPNGNICRDLSAITEDDVKPKTIESTNPQKWTDRTGGKEASDLPPH